MICDDAAEYVSALCDGELVPSSMTEHIATCSKCQERLRDYLAIGVELRTNASLELSSPIPALVWNKSKSRATRWWQEGLETMKIPRLAFAVLVCGVLVLASTLAAVKVRARSDGPVVLLTVTKGDSSPIECALSTVDQNRGRCASIGDAEGKTLGYNIEILKRNDNRVQLGIRTRVWSDAPGRGASHALADLEAQSEKLYWFEPGDTLKIEVPGLAPLTIKGNWLDHMPSFVGTNSLDPSADELRIISPILLQGKQVAGDLQGGATIGKRNWGAFIYYPGQGSYLISNSHLKDGIEARVDLNRISFEENGHGYALLTGTPITRAEHVWILHDPGFDPSKSGQSRDYAFLGSQMLQESGPGVWVSKEPH